MRDRVSLAREKGGVGAGRAHVGVLGGNADGDPVADDLSYPRDQVVRILVGQDHVKQDEVKV